MDAHRLMEPGLLVVSGKGGTGKSTIAAAVAAAAAARGRRVLLAEVEGREEVRRTLGVHEPHDEERASPFGLHVISITARGAAAEYLRRYAGMDRLSRPLLRSGALDQVVSGAPGFRDLLICGKLYELARTRVPDERGGAPGRPRYDLIVVDAPPTGQIAAFLAAPATFVELFRVGPMRRRAASVAAFIERRARVALVAVPEEMSVAETLEAVPALAATGVRLAAVIANRCEPPVFPPGTKRSGDRLSTEAAIRLAQGASLGLADRDLDAVLATARRAARRESRQRSRLRDLEPAGPVLRLPELVGGDGPDLVRALTDELLRGAGGPRTPSIHAERTVLRAVATHASVSRSARRRRAPLGLPRIVVVCGSGGVGKTTISAAIATRLAQDGRRTALLTVDPARRLATALRLPMVAGARTTVRLSRGRSMQAMQLDTKRTFDELVERFAATPERRQRIVSNPFYRRIADTLGGTHEYMAMEKLHQLAETEDYDAIVIDTPPTRSALSFLDAPTRLTDFLGGRFLRLMLWPTARAGRLTMGAARLGTRAFLRTIGRLVGADVLADTVEFLSAFETLFGGFRERAARVAELLRGPECAFVMVGAPTAVSLQETGAFLDRLAELEMRAAAVVVNRLHAGTPALPAGLEAPIERLGSNDPEARALAAALRCAVRERSRQEAETKLVAGFETDRPGIALVTVPELEVDVHDVAGLRRVARHLFD